MVVGFEKNLEGKLPVANTNPFVLELNRLQNQLKEKDRELGICHREIKALRAAEALRHKAVEELRNEVKKLDEKLGASENLYENKNLEIQKLTNEMKDALAAQFAAEATLRRVYTSQKDDDYVPLHSVIAPLEAEIKLHKNEIVALQEDKKALERLTKSKESALLEAEKILRSALERALIVEEVQNQNFELKRKIEICQEENRILEKTNRQKVVEVEKLSETIQELEEVILAGGAAANAFRDYQRQIHELNEEKRTLERELARVKVSAHRIAYVVANEWKDDNDKVMPVKQWLEERRVMQAETQRLRDKLVVSERTAKAEAQLKEKWKLRLKTLEDGLKHASLLSSNPNALCGSPKYERSNNILGFLTNNGEPKGVSSSKTKYASAQNMLRKRVWASRSKVVDNSGKENTERKANNAVRIDKCNDDPTMALAEYSIKGRENEDSPNKGMACSTANEDVVSGFLYDRLQKEVINLRKSCEVKENSLNKKEQEIKILVKKIEALTKAIKVQSRRFKREAAARERDVQSAKLDENNIRNTNSSKRVTKTS